MNFKEFVSAATNLQANAGEAVKNNVLQILQQPGNEVWKQSWDRMVGNPHLYQNFLTDVSQQSKGTYQLPPAQYLQTIKKHSLNAAGTKLPNPVQATPTQTNSTMPITPKPGMQTPVAQPIVPGRTF